MANFSTHIGVATAAGIVIAGSGLYCNLWPLAQTPAMIVLTGIGGIVPDIDADKSHSVRFIFTALAVLTAFSALALTHSNLSWVASTCLALACYIGVRDALGPLFRALTRHRASWHSLLAVTTVTVLTVNMSFRCLGHPARLAWEHGMAVAGGMLVHLFLDECFSFDLEGARFKRSFGTALKLFDYKRPVATALMAGFALMMMPWLPGWPF